MEFNKMETGVVVVALMLYEVETRKQFESSDSFDEILILKNRIEVINKILQTIDKEVSNG